MKFGTKLTVKLRKFFKVLGPGLVSGASDDDPSGIATYSQAGAQFGLGTLWTALFTFPLMAAIQGMCARIGLVTSQGLTVTLKKNYPKPILYLALLLGFPAITLNIGADIQSIGAVSHMLFPVVPAFVFSLLFTFALIFFIIKYPYEKIARVLKWLCLFLLLYILVPFVVKHDWSFVLKKALMPDIKWDKGFLSMLVAILGTTISPYLFFWQTTMEAEDNAHKEKVVINKRVLGNLKTDINSGMLLSNLVMFFIILTAGSVLYTKGTRQIATVEQAAKALEPLTGRFAYLIFALAIIGTGLLAIPVLAGSQSYMLAETFGWKAGFDRKFQQARPFYFAIIVSLLVGLSLDFLGISPMQALLYTAILYGITAPVMIAVILHIGNNKRIMGEFTNSKLSNTLGFITLILMTASAIGLLIQFTT
ncbi:MAG TPA: divalent metal cation transporter [Bacteroidales bacterium]|nr:divalent metal cation transporter [Bacteroidales bacterium]